MPRYAIRLIRTIADLVYPPRCPLCDRFVRAHAEPCGACKTSLHRLEGDAFFPHLAKTWFERCRSCFAYDGHLREALHRCKYGERLDLVHYLAAEAWPQAQKLLPIDLIVPVPLHRKRLAFRGFNQSALIAKGVGCALWLPVDVKSLARIRSVPPQVGKSREERIKNIAGAFAVRDGRAEALDGKNILLIDDVVTTGATVNECAKMLRNAGVKSVSVLSIARTL
jgi:ComF family protein